MRNEETGLLPIEHRQTFIGGGAKLDIVVTEIRKDEWVLAVVNEAGVSSNWCEFFDSCDCAVEAALNAIRDEGVMPFQDIEGFEYLQDDDV